MGHGWWWGHSDSKLFFSYWVKSLSRKAEYLLYTVIKFVCVSVPGPDNDGSIVGQGLTLLRTAQMCISLAPYLSFSLTSEPQRWTYEGMGGHRISLFFPVWAHWVNLFFSFIPAFHHKNVPSWLLRKGAEPGLGHRLWVPSSVVSDKPWSPGSH